MRAAQLLDHLSASGVRLELHGGKLRAGPPAALTAGVLGLIAENRPGLVNLLTAADPGELAPEAILEPAGPSHWTDHYARWFAGIAEPRAVVTLTQGQARAAVTAGLVSADLHRASVLLAYRSPLGVRGLLAIPRERYDAFKVAEVLGDDAQEVTT